MIEIDSAYRILGLERGATSEEIEEAYLELREVWRPDRFSDNEELRAKAERKQRAVEDAYQVIKEKLSKSATQTISEKENGGRGPSLLDDTFSERMGKSKQKFPIWIILFGLVAVAVVISFFTWSPVEVESEPEPSATEKLLAEMRAKEVKEEEASEEDNLTPAPQEDILADQPESTESADRPVVTSPEPPLERPKETPEPPPVQPKKSATPVAPPPVDTPTKQEPIPEASEDAAAEPAPEEEPVVSELAERSFQILRAKSDLANQLVEGTIDNLSYKEWKAVERSDSEVYVDLIAEVTSEGRDAHFVWAVDVEAQSVKPMSQAARDLQSEER
jgi:outer membrane biosynthesis protein TonB